MANGTLVGLFGGLFDMPRVGKPSPPFTVTTFDGRKFTLLDLAGDVIVLNFWATWCAPCRVELPMLDSYVRSHPHPDLKLFAVTTENSVPNSKLKPLAAVLSFPLAKQISGGGYGDLGAVPTNFVIDRAGIVRYAKAAAFTEETFDAVVSPLLAAPAPGQVRTA
jgi:cytochrome c biogenesis protein CcmG, thiol:disulfide interchange protein DsbE